MEVESVSRVVAVRTRTTVVSGEDVTLITSVLKSVRDPVSVPVTITGTVDVKRSCWDFITVD